MCALRLCRSTPHNAAAPTKGSAVAQLDNWKRGRTPRLAPGCEKAPQRNQRGLDATLGNRSGNGS